MGSVRRDAIEASPVLRLFPQTLRRALEVAAHEEIFQPGIEVLREGTQGDLLYVVVSGRGEVTTESANGTQTLALLGSGDTFGEIAVIDGGGRRHATVTAVSALIVLVIEGAAFRRALRNHPDVLRQMQQMRERMLDVKLMKQSPTFAVLSPAQLADLTDTVQRTSFPSGSAIIRQGEAADTCYLLRSGKVRVVVQTATTEAELAVLEAGALFGERALIGEAVRNASVYAVTDCDMLIVHRADLIRVLHQDRRVLSEMKHLVQVRECPRARPGIEVRTNESPGGTPAAVLVNPVSDDTYLLSPEALFLWSHMDGTRTLRDLVHLYEQQFGPSSSDCVRTTVEQLGRQGFLAETTWREDIRTLRDAALMTRWQWRVTRIAATIHVRRANSASVGYALPPPISRPQAGSLEESVSQYQGARTQMARIIRYWDSQGDTRAAFLRCYWNMTGAMLTALDENQFQDPTWVFALLNRFADYYFNALTAYDLSLKEVHGADTRLPHAWRIAFRLTETRSATLPEQLLTGINAHINRDLPLVLYELLGDSWSSMSEDQRACRFDDYARVNVVIAGTVETVQRDVVERYARLLGLMSRVAGPASTLVANGLGRIIVSWRDQVWHVAMQLVEETDEGRVRVLLDRLERDSAARGRRFASRLLWRDRVLLRRGETSRTGRLMPAPHAPLGE